MHTRITAMSLGAFFTALLLHTLLAISSSASRSINYGTERFGWDLHPTPIDCSTSQRCSQLCEEEARCISWSYRQSNCMSLSSVAAGCWLKQALAGAQLDPCSDSGWIAERMEPRCRDSEYAAWPNSRRGKSSGFPAQLSITTLDLQLAVNCTITYTKSDTWYCSWAADDTLRCMFEDGTVNGIKVNGHPNTSSTLATSGLVTVQGDHPFNLSLHNATVVSSNVSVFLGRFPSANIYMDGVWFVANAVRNDVNAHIADCGGHCVMGPLTAFQTSTDDGHTWADPTPLPDGATHNLFQQHSGNALDKHVKFGEVHVVDCGQAQQWCVGGWTYMVGHGSEAGYGDSWELWNQGDALYVARVQLSLASVNDAEQWQFWCGDELDWVQGAVVGGGVACAAAVLVWPNRTGSVSMTYVPSLDRFLTVYTTPHTANRPLDGSDLVLLESTAITGPFRLVNQMDLFGPTAYFPTIPSKFMSPHLTTTHSGGAELRLWLAFSTLSTYKYGLFGNPPFTAYAWNLMAVRLVLTESLGADGGLGAGVMNAGDESGEWTLGGWLLLWVLLLATLSCGLVWLYRTLFHHFAHPSATHCRRYTYSLLSSLE